jgi:hypothetical protein
MANKTVIPATVREILGLNNCSSKHVIIKKTINTSSDDIRINKEPGNGAVFFLKKKINFYRSYLKLI